MRDGMGALIAASGMKIGFVTGTDPRQMALIFKMLKLELDPNVFH
ncbi:MAG: hypothetical protein AAGG57_18095 [Pseudomonadota bacterium]